MRRVTSIAAALVAVSFLVLPSMSFGQATVVRDTVTAPIVPESGLTACVPGVTGTLTGTDVFSYQSVASQRGLHITATQTDTAKIAWSDGTYSLIESVEHISFFSGTDIDLRTFAHEDSGDLYTADGAFLAHFTTHSISHVTVTNGAIRVEFDKSHLNLFGQDCP